ncbi:ABC transporter substrate-binding protein [Bacillaceae bacterium Marseille-Q3522]|nr:ABC transporter substrate-binding protein [Bacillaceae bacterium Marseille-Q3522]
MKKLVTLFVIIFLVSFGIMALVAKLNASQGYTSGNTLTVFNWGDYIDPELITRFEKETGIKVVYETFDSNEAMLTKIEQGGTSYDIAVPSEYTVDKMIKEDLLIPIDHNKLPNLNAIDDRFIDMPFDPENQYSVPYFWGTVGIVYNPSQLGGKKITGWNDLWDEDLRNQIMLVDGAREVIGMGLNSLGYSLNDKNPEHLQEAKQKLEQLTPNIKAIVGDEIKMMIETEEALIGVVWSGSAQEIMWGNDEIEYVLPEDGSNIWTDNLVIPKTAKNVEGAHKFINFLLDPEVAAQNTTYVGYSTPNEQALTFMDEAIVNDKRFYPTNEMTENYEVYENLGPKMLAYYNDLFLEFKMHRK